jgi:uncharacterized membrane protein YgcG
MIITDEKLAMINAGRAARGLPPLTKQEAIKLARDRRAEAIAQSNNSDQSSDFLMHYLIGYATGIPFPSAGGLIGAAMHPTSKPDSVDVIFNNEPRTFKFAEPNDPTNFDRTEPSPSSDSSSSSLDSGSSSSSDSGSSGGGGGGE